MTPDVKFKVSANWSTETTASALPALVEKLLGLGIQFTVDTVVEPVKKAQPGTPSPNHASLPVKGKRKKRRGARYRSKLSLACKAARERAERYRDTHGITPSEGVRREVLRFAQNNPKRSVTWNTAAEIAFAHGCSTAMGTRALNKLRRARLLTRTDRGVYVLTEQGRQEAA